MNNEAITKNDLRAILQELGMPFTPLDYYPIGAYFETSDSTFDPNTVWGGTWVLETSGYVHVSGDASGASSPSYPVSKANNNSGAGASDGGASTVTLQVSQIPAHKHRIAYRTGVVASGTAGMWYFDPGTAGSWTTSPSIENTGGGGSHNNMQPYINVYRWHRTA